MWHILDIFNLPAPNSIANFSNFPWALLNIQHVQD